MIYYIKLNTSVTSQRRDGSSWGENCFDYCSWTGNWQSKVDDHDGHDGHDVEYEDDTDDHDDVEDEDDVDNDDRFDFSAPSYWPRKVQVWLPLISGIWQKTSYINVIRSIILQKCSFSKISLKLSAMNMLVQQYHLNQRSDLLESLASEAAKENLSITVRTLDVTKKVTQSTK